MDSPLCSPKRPILAVNGPETSEPHKKQQIDPALSEYNGCNRAIHRISQGSAQTNLYSIEKVSQPAWRNVFVSPARVLGNRVLCFRCKDMLGVAFEFGLYAKPPFSQSIPKKSSIKKVERKLRNDLPQQLCSNSTTNRRKLDSFEELQRTAKGCPMCCLIWLTLKKSYGTTLIQARKYSDGKFNPDDTEPHYKTDGITDIDDLMERREKVVIWLKLSFVRSSTPLHASHLRLEFDILYKTGAGRRRFRNRVEEELLILVDFETELSMKLGVPIDPRLQLSAKFDLMKRWISRDADGHAYQCADFLPTRLLYINEDGYIRVMHMELGNIDKDGSGRSKVIKYVALSHRWGASQHFTSNSITIKQRSSGFSIDELPATFRDAVHVVTRLGFSYLWIDALCILQDDENDWEKQAKEMGDVFGHAQFTIAAHCATDDSEGFLAKSMAKRSAVEFHHSGGTAFRICQRANFEADVTNSQLCKRGWVLQERFLASMIIHFTEGQVFFETSEEVQSEDGHVKLLALDVVSGSSSQIGRSKVLSPSTAPRLREFLKLHNHPNSRPPNHELDGKDVGSPLEWLDLIETYSNCDLTNEKDKLMAIAGMAQKIYLRTHTAYCAGIWSDRISQGLLWMPQNIPLSRPTYHRAPSWSWAAFDGPIQFPKDVKAASFVPRCKLLAVNGFDTQSDTGRLYWLDGPGYLQLEAEILDLGSTWVSWNIEEFGPGPPRRGSAWEADPSISLKSFVKVRKISRTFLGSPIGWIAFDEESKTVKTVDLPGFCFAMVGFDERHPLFLGRHRMTFGLFLVTNRPSKSEYRRIGSGQMLYSKRTATLRTIKIV